MPFLRMSFSITHTKDDKPVFIKNTLACEKTMKMTDVAQEEIEVGGPS